MTTHAHDASEHEHGGGHHVDPMWMYLTIFGALIFMTVVTVAASYVDFGSANTVIAVVIATIKATLVSVFFMHLRHDKRFNAIVFVSALLFLSFLFLFVLSDFGTRTAVDDWHGADAPGLNTMPKEMPSSEAAKETPESKQHDAHVH